MNQVGCRVEIRIIQFQHDSINVARVTATSKSKAEIWLWFSTNQEAGVGQASLLHHIPHHSTLLNPTKTSPDSQLSPTTLYLCNRQAQRISTTLTWSGDNGNFLDLCMIAWQPFNKSHSRSNTSPSTRWTMVRCYLSSSAFPPINSIQRDTFALHNRNLYAIVDTSSPAHTTDIFSLAATPHGLLSGSGSSTINVHRTTDPAGVFPIAQSLPAHKLGCHHIATSPRGGTGRVAASVGFGGDVKVWRCDADTGDWALDFEITPAQAKSGGGGDVWAVALDAREKYLACTAHDGRIHVWDLETKGVVQTYETGGAGAGSFGLCVDFSPDGKLTASGHHNGSVYVFNNDVGHLKYSLSGTSLPPLSLQACSRPR